MPRIILYAEIKYNHKGVLVAATKTETVAPFLQILFLIVVVGAWAIELGFQAIQAVEVYGHNPNLSSYYTAFLYTAIIPLLLFGLGVFLNRRYAQGRQVVFENVLIALVGMTFCSLISFAVQIAMRAGAVTLKGSLSWWWLEIAVAFVSFALYVGVLFFARRKGYWN